MVRFGASELHNIAAIIGGVGAQVGRFPDGPVSVLGRRRRDCMGLALLVFRE
jgi:hypothetical protein